ncbi:ATP-binding cassette domain-containing protein (plasmid) [Devosia sp. A8/3-2]|nr:ATP-binding cassette domain-containing protein [Devosia sp. A8/3-2]
MTNQPLLSIRNLKVQFAVREGSVRAVDGVDVDAHAGKTLCIVGESGSGKSMLARSILQIVSRPGRVTDGEIVFCRPGQSRWILPSSIQRASRF